jgi:hypothetical protein
MRNDLIALIHFDLQQNIFWVTHSLLQPLAYFRSISNRLNILMKPHTATLNFQKGNNPLT